MYIYIYIYIYMVVTLFNKNTLDFGKVQVVITQPFFIESF